MLPYKGHIFHHVSDHRDYHKHYYIGSLHLLVIWNPFFHYSLLYHILQ